jgi:signal peptidase I
MLAKHVVNGAVVVLAGKYFVLGDNSDNSLDSRYWGFLDGADIMGKPRLIYASEEARTPGVLVAHGGGSERVRWGRLFKTL